MRQPVHSIWINISGRRSGPTFVAGCPEKAAFLHLKKRYPTVSTQEASIRHEQKAIKLIESTTRRKLHRLPFQISRAFTLEIDFIELDRCQT